MDVMIKESDLDQLTDQQGDLAAVRDSLVEISVQIGRSLASARHVIRLFENGDEARAYTHLARLLDSVRVLFTVFSQDFGWAETPEAEISLEESSSALEHALSQLIKAHQNRFWISICDVIEYEIAPLLESWQKIVARTHAEAN
jgi:hypothetical protein